MSEKELPVGRRLVIVRALLAKTQEKLAQEMEVTPGLISKWETGERDIPLGRLEQIERMYGVSLVDEGWQQKIMSLPTNVINMAT